MSNFWPCTTERIQLEPTLVIWHHIREMRKISEELKAKMGFVVDCYSDLRADSKILSDFNYGQKLLILSWDKTIKGLIPGQHVSMADLVYAWKANLFKMMLNIFISKQQRRS